MAHTTSNFSPAFLNASADECLYSNRPELEPELGCDLEFPVTFESFT